MTLHDLFTILAVRHDLAAERADDPRNGPDLRRVERARASELIFVLDNIRAVITDADYSREGDNGKLD